MYRSLISLMPKAQPLLLDLYPSAAVAYSLRKLRTAYSGSAIRVRRAVDGIDQDFGFNDFNDTLIDWVGYNLWTFSEEWDNVAWVKSGLNLTGTPPYVNVETAPDSTLTADKIIESTISQGHLTSRQLLVTNGVTYNVSVYLKHGGRDVRVFSPISNLVTYQVDVDLTNGILSGNTFPIAPILENVGSGWYRLSYSGTATNNQTRNVITINLLNPSAANPINYLGNGVSGVFIWGSQITATSLVRKYTKTVATANAGNASIHTWYDQSGNGRDAVQSLTTNQAAIVQNGSFITIGSKITTSWSTDSYTIPAFSTAKPLVSTFVFKRNGIGNAGQCSSFSNNSTTTAAVLRWLGATSNDLNTYLNPPRIHSVNNQTLGYFLLTTYKNNADFVNIRNNTVELSGGINLTGNGTINSFGNGNGSATTGNVNEAILWHQDYISLIPEIETKINEYYAIY